MKNALIGALMLGAATLAAPAAAQQATITQSIAGTRLDLTASGPYGDASNPNHAAFQTQLDAERTRQEDGLDRGVIRNLPVFEIGMRVRVF